MRSIVDWLFGIEGIDLGEGGGWQLVFQSDIALWVVFMVIIPLVIAFCWVVYRKEQGFLTKTRRYILVSLRILAVMLLLTLLFEPVFSVERTLKRRGVVLLLVDDSRSMSIKDDQYDPEVRNALEDLCGKNPIETTRMDLVRAMFANEKIQFLKKLGEENDVRVCGFSSALKRDIDVAKLMPEGDITQIGSAIMEAMNDVKGRHLQAVVLVTDGRSNAGIPLSSISRVLRDRQNPVPVYAIGVGSEKPPRDIRLVNLAAEPVVMIKDEVVFDFDYENHGFENEEITIKLWDETEKKSVAEKKVKLGPSGIRTADALKYKPERAGEYRFRVEIDAKPGELIKTNNAIKQTVTVVDKKLKVLYVDGKPRWEYVYLKNALVRDKTIEAWCYLAEAEEKFPQEVSLSLRDQKDAPLRAFPGELKDLEKYDVIIIGDVDIRKLGDPKRPGDSKVEWTKIVDNLVKFVEDLGGGVVFAAGTGHNPATYRGTGLEKLLPVVVPEIALATPRVYKDPFHPRLTPLGKEDPLLRMQGSGPVNVEFWEDNDHKEDGLPPLYWFYAVKEAKPAAKVLASHPNGTPLVVTQFYGRGRAMFVATDETWRWRENEKDRYFYKFWGEALQRMRQGKIVKSKRYSLFVGPGHALGEKVPLEAQVLDDDLQPSRDPSHQATVRTPEGKSVTVDLLAVKDKPGSYQGVYDPKEEGEYIVMLGPSGKGTMEVFSVALPKLEFENTLLNQEGLNVLSNETGGMFVRLHQVHEVIEPLRGLRTTDYREHKERELWDTPFMLMLFTLLVVVEWVFRKRWGLT